ncbi:hypothetical protein ACNTMW_25360 [Planosporangium sp. 12N6]|uniref:hypothetical protein n=1 Tax=Planosporangium spinosum TaxID=3402278 RepID=UPI003CE89D94
MRIRGALLALFGAAAPVQVFGVLIAERKLELQAGLVALAALTGYAALAGRTARPGVRWPLLAGVAVLTARTAVDLARYRSPGPMAWMVSTEPPPSWPDLLGQGLWRAAPVLLAYACLAAAVVALPPRRRPRLGAVAAGAALLGYGYLGYLLVTSGYGMRGLPGGDGLRENLGGLVPALLVLGIALAAAVLAGQRAGAGALAGPGLALMVVPTTLVGGSLALVGVQTLFAYPLDVDRTVPSFVELGVRVGAESVLQPAAAVASALYLVGLALVVIGCLGRPGRRSGHPEGNDGMPR